jgi:SET domain-containing protein
MVKKRRKTPRVGTGRRRYRLGRSKIQGRGVFATERIRKATRIVEYTGEIVEEEEATRRAFSRKVVLLFDLGDGSYIDGDPNAPGPCVNHSCDPNCFTTKAGRRIFIAALRRIEPGEELTYDYSIRKGITLECRCGAVNCRGTLNLAPKKGRRR